MHDVKVRQGKGKYESFKAETIQIPLESNAIIVCGSRDSRHRKNVSDL